MTGVEILFGGFWSKGLKLTNEADESSAGPASFMVVDPDGNPVFIDQHV